MWSSCARVDECGKCDISVPPPLLNIGVFLNFAGTPRTFLNHKQNICNVKLLIETHQYTDKRMFLNQAGYMITAFHVCLLENRSPAETRMS